MSDKKTNDFIAFFKDAIDLGKELFKDKLAFADWKLQDGTTIVRTDTDTIAQGSKITVVSDSGEVPLVDGEYTIMVNDAPTTVTVASGYVTDVAQGTDDATDATANADPNAMAGLPGGETKVSLEDVHAKVGDHEKRIGMLEQGMAEMKPKADAPAMCSKEDADAKFATLEKENGEMKALLKAMFDAMQKMSEASAEPTDAPKTKFKREAVKVDNFAAMSLDEKIKKLQTYK